MALAGPRRELTLSHLLPWPYAPGASEEPDVKRFCVARWPSSFLVAVPAWAQFSKPELAVKYRKAAMFLLGNHCSVSRPSSM